MFVGVLVGGTDVLVGVVVAVGGNPVLVAVGVGPAGSVNRYTVPP